MSDIDRTNDQDLLADAARFLATTAGEPLTAETLAPIAASQGIDFAAALVYEQVKREPRCAALIRWMANDEPMIAPERDVLVGLVPGAFYAQHRHTGSDGQRVLDAVDRLGFRGERILVESFGLPRDNAAIIRDWVEKHTGERIVLVSLSKGGSDVKTALAEPGAAAAFRSVVAWIDLSGILEGTAIANWILAQQFRMPFVRLIFWWNRLRIESLRAMRRGPEFPLGSAVRIPSGMRVVHVVGFPLQRHLSNPWAIRAHARLRPFGPNDGGGILLTDAVRRPGWIYPVWGQDHYLRSVDVTRFVGRLLAFALDRQENLREGTTHEDSTLVAGR
jgi:hypothetical protein